MATVNQLKNRALAVLLSTTFSYVQQNIYAAYTQVAKENAKLQNTHHPERVLFFMQEGVVYPSKSPSGMPIQTIPVRAPTLHYSLMPKVKKIKQQLDDAGFTQIKNLFSAILTNSFHGVVLETFLPQVLLAALQKSFNEEEYYAINHGDFKENEPPYTLTDVAQNIRMIKEFYKDSLALLKTRLMEQFLLQ